MPRSSTLTRISLVLIAVAMLTASCTGGGDGASTTTSASSSTTSGGAAGTETTTSTTEAGGDELDPGVAEELRKQVAELVVATEDVRGLPFLRSPEVAVLSHGAFADRVRSLVAEDLDPDELQVDARLYTLFGMLDPGVDLEQMLLDLFAEQVVGFYDGDTHEMVVAGDQADVSPYQRTVIVHELIHALTDQHFEFDVKLRTLVDEKRYDEAAALQALVEGDATYFQLVYMQSLPPGEQIGLLAEALAADLSVLESVPDFIRADLEFPYDQGMRFVERLVSVGGIAAVDRAYVDLPTTTEQILHPQKYEGGESPKALDAIDLTIPGYETQEVSTWGEWGLRLLFTDLLSPASLTQTADGWGGDTYGVYYDEDDVAFAMIYVGDAESDAIELAGALLELARDRLALGDGVDEAGGKLFDTEDRWLFIDRRGDELVFIASTDPVAGEALLAQL